MHEGPESNKREDDCSSPGLLKLTVEHNGPGARSHVGKESNGHSLRWGGIKTLRIFLLQQSGLTTPSEIIRFESGGIMEISIYVHFSLVFQWVYESLKSAASLENMDREALGPAICRMNVWCIPVSYIILLRKVSPLKNFHFWVHLGNYWFCPNHPQFHWHFSNVVWICKACIDVHWWVVTMVRSSWVRFFYKHTPSQRYDKRFLRKGSKDLARVWRASQGWGKR